MADKNPTDVKGSGDASRHALEVELLKLREAPPGTEPSPKVEKEVPKEDLGEEDAAQNQQTA